MYAERYSELPRGPASDRIHRLSRQCRTECDLTSISDMDDQSLRGQAPLIVRTEPTSHGITFSRHDVLEASHTRKASPLLAGFLDGITSAVGQFTYPTRNFATLGPFIVVTHSRSNSVN